MKTQNLMVIMIMAMASSMASADYNREKTAIHTGSTVNVHDVNLMHSKPDCPELAAKGLTDKSVVRNAQATTAGYSQKQTR